jgi:hypothetical protein
VTPDQRAAWLASTRAVLNAVEAHPELPPPYTGEDGAHFYLTTLWGQDARRALADVETALAGSLGVTFTASTEDAGSNPDYYYLLTARTPGGHGLPIVIRAIASEVAEQKVTGRVTTDVTEWVRRPVGEPGQGDGEATP